ncbi:hypothetical protein Tco_0951107 [Tanacetum coccineum]|uniref:Uncharacterized protein n=1 Tax=Tanacetum coccineum TaxID=301880 RepID=A0ABQ5DVK7_9ASTR
MAHSSWAWLTDVTSEITDEELLEFTSEYYIPFALHPVMPAASASIADFPEGKVGKWFVQQFPSDKPKLVTEGVRPLRDGEEPLLESTAGRTMELVLEQPEVESTDVLAPIPLRRVPGAESEAGEVDSGLKRKRGTSDDGADTSKRVRYVSLGGSTSTKEETETPPLNLCACRRLLAIPSFCAGDACRTDPPPQTVP